MALDEATRQIQEDFFSQQEQARSDYERQAEVLYFRAMGQLSRISEDIIMNDRSQAMARSNIARACFEGAAYAKREAASLRRSIPTEEHPEHELRKRTRPRLTTGALPTTGTRSKDLSRSATHAQTTVHPTGSSVPEGTQFT